MLYKSNRYKLNFSYVVWGVKEVLKKLILSEKDYEYLTKGLASGVGLGIIIGALVEDILFFFALGGILGIIGSGIFSFYRKFKVDNKI